MRQVASCVKKYFSFGILIAFLFFALFNPFFKKYDYGAGWPLVLLLGVLLVFIVGFEFLKNRERVFAEKIFLLVFLGSIIVSFYLSTTKNVGFSEVMAYASMVPLYMVFAYRENQCLEKFLKSISVLVVFAVILGYFLYFFLPETRMFGPFFNIQYHSNVWPNAFALFLLMTWPILLIFNEKKHKWKLSILVGVVLSALLLTFSRGALIVLGGQLVLLTIYYFRKLTFNNLLYVVLGGLVAILLFLASNNVRSMTHEVIELKERVTFSNNEGLTSKTERIDFWKGAIELTGEKPFFGWGPFSFRQAYSPHQTTLLGSSDHPHNLFLKISAENGLIALGSFIAFLTTLFLTVTRRFSKLSKKNKDLLFIMSVSVLGAFAHSLIDYNFNFISNLTLLFLLLAFIRSLVVGRRKKERKAILPLFLALFIAIISIFELSILFLDTIDDDNLVDNDYIHYSMFPRGHYIDHAEDVLSKGFFKDSLLYLDKQLAINPLDSRTYFLKGVYYANMENPARDIQLAQQNFRLALDLNPLGDFGYYRDYFRTLVELKQTDEIQRFIDEVSPLLNTYFGYVENNVHFTAYTDNVESAANLIDLMLPYASGQVAADLLVRKSIMLDTAEDLRAQKKF